MGPFVLSSVGPFIRFICSEAVGGTAGKSGAGCGMCPRMAFHHLLRQLLVMGPPGPTLLAFARYFPLAVCHAGLFGPAQMTASAWARRSEVWGLLPLQLGHPPYVRVGNQLRASRASPCGAGVRSLSQCYFNHVPDKLFWTFWPMFVRFWKLFSLFSPCLHRDAKRWLSQGQLYLGFFGIFNEEFSENWLERLALTPSPAGYSPLQLTFSLFIQFPPPSRISHQPALIPSIFSLAAAVVPRFKMERS